MLVRRIETFSKGLEVVLDSLIDRCLVSGAQGPRRITRLDCGPRDVEKGVIVGKMTACS